MSTTPRLPSAVDGQEANFGTVFAHQPALMQSFFSFYGHLWMEGVLDHPTKEVARLRNARITDCGY